MTDSLQWGRKASLLLLTGPLQGNNPSAYLPGGDRGLDLSEMHFTFQTKQQDVESPNNCTIRVYNLSQATVKQIRGEFSRVVLQAGYQGTSGVIFDGTIRQFRIGRENATDTYLDILAADGDIGYNFGIVNQSLKAGSTPQDRLGVINAALANFGLAPGSQMPFTGGVLPRGKVLFGMARSELRTLSASQEATWSIQNGKVDIIPLRGYKEGEAVVLTSLTGLIGIPEATTEGVQFRCLLNPRLVPGAVARIDNRSINQTLQQNPNNPPVAFDRYIGLQQLADVTSDGFYRMFVVEHSGDTRGQGWYTDVVGLALDPSNQQVKPYG